MTVPVDFVLIIYMYICTEYIHELCVRRICPCLWSRFLSNKNSVCKSMYVHYLDKDLFNTDKIQVIRHLYIIISYLYVYIVDILAG